VLELAGGVLLGCSLGANDLANVFGTAVAARVVRFATAAGLAAVAIVAGAWLEGHRGIETLGSLATVAPGAAVLTTLSAAAVVALMTWLRLPGSTSQAVVGAIVGVGVVAGRTDFGVLPKIMVCWVATPIGAVLLACVSYRLLGLLMNRLRISMLTRDRLLWGALVVVGTYGAYALGANNVANVTGVFLGTDSQPGASTLALIGGVSMALGAAALGKRVMMTVGARLVRLDAYAALVAVLAQAWTVHVFARIGVPVSSSQALVGGVIGVSLMRGARGIDREVLKSIALAWILTPLAAGFAAGLAARALLVA